jgi:hypothetical protein
MPQIADRLEKLGLAPYADSPFPQNEIDLAILNHLTRQDLERIGVASLEHRAAKLATPRRSQMQ